MILLNRPNRKEDFIEDKQLIIPPKIFENNSSNERFFSDLIITRIGFFPAIKFHYRERLSGCPDNILFYCLGGRGYYHTNSGTFTLKANQFVILPANQYHRYYADIEDPWTIYWIHYRGNQLLQFDNYFEIGKYLEPTDIPFDERIIQAWEEIYYAVKSSFSLPNIIHANLCLPRYISLFVHHNISINTENTKDLISQVRRFLKNNIEKMLRSKDIAKEFHYSVSHFSNLFKKETGKPPLEYFNELKVHHACQLLDQSRLKIKEIAAKVGYEDPYYFSRIFTRIMGRSPKKYRVENHGLNELSNHTHS